MMRRAQLLALVAAFALGCGSGSDAEMWDCQLAVQKGNAGRSANDNAERTRDIESCMSARGYRLDMGKPACRQGSVDASCYRAR